MKQIRVKSKSPFEIEYFHRWEFIENLFKFTPIWELELTNFSLSSKIYESYKAS